MQVYSVKYQIRGKEEKYSALVEAAKLQTVKNKLGRKHGYKDGRMINFIEWNVVGYF